MGDRANAFFFDAMRRKIGAGFSGGGGGGRLREAILSDELSYRIGLDSLKFEEALPTALDSEVEALEESEVSSDEELLGRAWAVRAQEKEEAQARHGQRGQMERNFKAFAKCIRGKIKNREGKEHDRDKDGERKKDVEALPLPMAMANEELKDELDWMSFLEGNEPLAVKVEQRREEEQQAALGLGMPSPSLSSGQLTESERESLFSEYDSDEDGAAGRPIRVRGGEHCQVRHAEAQGAERERGEGGREGKGEEPWRCLLCFRAIKR